MPVNSKKKEDAELPSELTPQISSISVNYDRSAFAVGLVNGYRIYGIHPLQELYRQGTIAFQLTLSPFL